MHEDVVTRFYECFAVWDADGMAACYADDVHFNDGAFGDLKGAEAGDMWRMLCERAKDDLKVVASHIRSDGDVVRAHWDATYHFGPKKRLVHNSIEATFRFNADGQIVQHTDVFDVWRWSRQALGLPGVLLGWSPIIRGAIRKQALGGLRAYRARRARA